MSMFLKHSLPIVFARNVGGSLWRGLSSAVQGAGAEVELLHLEGDLEGVAVIGLQRGAAKNSFR